MLPSFHHRRSLLLRLRPLLPFSSSSSSSSSSFSLTTHHHFSTQEDQQQQQESDTTTATTPPTPTPQSIYQGVFYHRKSKRWIAEVRHRGKRLLHKLFLPEHEKEAALAVDAAMREHLGKDVLTNFHARTGIFLDPKNAFPPLPLSPSPPPFPPSSSSSSSSPSSFLLTNHIIRGITYVPEMDKYKAVIKSKNRPILLGFYKNKLEALVAIDDYTKLLSPEGEGGMKEAPRQSKYLGVSWDSYHERWVARLNFEGKRVLSQAFRDELEDEAARVYDIHARKYHGNDALTNFDEDGVFLDPKNRVMKFAQSPTGEGGGASSSASSGSAGVVDFRGVSWSREMQMWQAQIQVQGRRFHLGFFANPQDAALSYDAAGRRHHGSRAKCNFDEEGKRTKVRINLKNSAFAKAKYTMLSPGGGETGTTGTTGK